MGFKNKIVKFLINFIPNKTLRKDLREKYITPERPYVKSQYYGKIYTPYYPDAAFIEEKPEIYNKAGKLMDIFFLRDRVGSRYPYCIPSKYFLWDKYNISLKTHFYTNGTILETMGNPDKRYAVFNESESIIPNEYKIFETHKGIEKDFDSIFTYSEKLLDSLDNAKLFISCASIWYSQEQFNNENDPVKLSDTVYEKKIK